MTADVTPPAERRDAEADIERCLSDLGEALQLVRRALNTLAAVQEELHGTARPVPRVRHAMPSVGPRIRA